MFILVIVIYIGIAVYEFVPLYKEKKIKDLLVNGVLFSFSFMWAILLCFGVKVPSPSTPIKEFITSIFGK